MGEFRFILEDVAAATGLQRTAVEHLLKNDLAPETTGGGRRRPRLFNDQGVAQLALVSGFYFAGVEITPAARIAQAFAAEMRLTTRENIPDLIADLERQAERSGGPTFSKKFSEINLDDRYERYCLVSEFIGDERYKTPRSEYVLEVVNREFVFHGRSGLQAVALFSDRVFDLTAAFRLENWQRGAGDVKLITIDAEARNDPYHARNLENAYHEARANAVSSIRVNVSSAVRQAFERLRVRLNPESSSNIGERP